MILHSDMYVQVLLMRGFTCDNILGMYFFRDYFGGREVCRSSVVGRLDENKNSSFVGQSLILSVGAHAHLFSWESLTKF